VDNVGRAAGVGVVFGNLERAAVVKQPVEDERRLVALVQK